MSVQTAERTAVEDVFGPCPKWCTVCRTYPRQTVELGCVMPASRLHRGLLLDTAKMTVAVQQYDDAGDRMPVDVVVEIPSGQASLTPRERADLIAALIAAGAVTS